jgi:P-type Cu+ transporter
MAVASEVARIPVAGMTCDHCVGTVRRALEGVPGVRSAAVDLAAGRAEVAFDPQQADPARLKAAIEAAGYSVPSAATPAAPPANLVTIGPSPQAARPISPSPLRGEGRGEGSDAQMRTRPSSPSPLGEGRGEGQGGENTPRPQSPHPDPLSGGERGTEEPPSPAQAKAEEWELAIGGMHCASCVARVEGALAGVPGVEQARVNLATERARVVVDPGRVSLEALAGAVGRAGYSARRAEVDPAAGAEALRRERAEQVASWRNRLVVGVALTVPLVVLGYAPMLAPAAFGHAAWVGWAMLTLAAPLQIYLGGPYLRGAWERLRQGSSNMDTLIALGTATAFGYSLYHLLAGHAHQAHYFMEVLSIALTIAVCAIGAIFFGDGPSSSSK